MEYLGRKPKNIVVVALYIGNNRELSQFFWQWTQSDCQVPSPQNHPHLPARGRHCFWLLHSSGIA